MKNYLKTIGLVGVLSIAFTSFANKETTTPVTYTEEVQVGIWDDNQCHPQTTVYKVMHTYTLSAMYSPEHNSSTGYLERPAYEATSIKQILLEFIDSDIVYFDHDTEANGYYLMGFVVNVNNPEYNCVVRHITIDDKVFFHQETYGTWNEKLQITDFTTPIEQLPQPLQYYDPRFS